MPRVATEIPTTYEAILRPVVLEISRQLAVLLNLPQDISILFPGDAEEAAQHNSTLEKDGNASKFKYTQRFRVQFSENVVEDRVLATAVYQDENIPVFFDKKLGVKIKPVYSGTELVLSYTYRAENRAEARKFRDDMLMRTAMLRAENLHEITYHYELPVVFLHLLAEVYRMREAQEGYGDTFDDWVNAHITPKATNLTTLTGTVKTLAIAEKQVCPWGYFDFTAMPEPAEKDREGGSWNVNFEYRITIDKVIACVAEWPLVIHNQIIDEPWRESPNASGHLVDPNRRLRAPSSSRHSFDYFTPQLYPNPCRRKVDGVAIPHFDEWEPKQVHPETSTVAGIMLQVDPDDRHAVLNLRTDIPDYEIDPDIIAFLRGEGNNVARYGGSVFHITLYNDGDPLDEPLLMDRALNVRAANPMHPRERYHLRLALVNDLLGLESAAIDRLRMHGAACIKILNTLQWRLLGTAFTPKLLGGTTVAKSDIIKIGQRLNDQKRPHHTGIEYRMLTVGNFIIATHRSSDYASNEAEADGTQGDGSDFAPGDLTGIPGCDG